MSAIGNGYLSSNALTSFPFEDGQCLDWGVEQTEAVNELQCALQGCFVDAAVSLLAENVEQEAWPVVGAFSMTGNVLSFKVGSGSEEDDVFVSVTASQTKFPIVEGDAIWGRYLLTLSSEGILNLASLLDKLEISPPVQVPSSSPGRDGGLWLRLCARCISVNHHGLSSIRVYDGVHPKIDGPHFILQGDVVVLPGNNMRISQSDDSEGFVLNASPGAGTGKCPCECEETEEGNGALAGPDGHARIFNDTCYDLEPREKYYDSTLGMVSQDILVHAKCTACCTCEMYESIVNDRLSMLADAIRKAKRDIYGQLEKYEDAVDKFNKRISAPTLSDVTLSMSAMPVGRNVSPNIGDGDVTGKMSRCAFTAIVRNHSYFEVIATVNAISGTDTVVEASAAWSDASGAPQSATEDSAAGVVNRSFSIFPGRSLVLTYISAKNNLVKSVETGNFSGTATFDLSYRKDVETVVQLGSITKTVNA